MTTVEIKELKTDEYNIWDNLVDISPQSTIFHKLEWLKIIEKHTKSRLFLFVGYLGNEIIAAIPFFYIKNYLYKVVSSPIESAMVQNLGPIIPNYEKLKQDKREFYFREFQKELDKYIYTRIDPHLIRVTTSPDLIDIRPYIWSNYRITPRYNYIKNIENLDDVWNDFKKELRKNIIKSEKNCIEIEEGKFNNYNIIIESLSNRLEEQELKLPVSNQYMLDLYKAFSSNGLKVFISNFEGKQVSGIICTTYKDKISIWVGATQANLKGLYPVDLLQWKIMEWGNKNGFKYCEILGANMPTISYFKSRYNFNLDIYFSVEKKRYLPKIGESIYRQFKKYV